MKKKMSGMHERALEGVEENFCSVRNNGWLVQNLILYKIDVGGAGVGGAVLVSLLFFGTFCYKSFLTTCVHSPAFLQKVV
jgi:hypothetical protein